MNKSERGFTLMEVIVGLVLLGFGLLAALMVKKQLDSYQRAALADIEKQSILTVAEGSLHLFLGQAVDVTYAGNVSLNAETERGMIRAYDLSTWTSVEAPRIDTLALFWMEQESFQKRIYDMIQRGDTDPRLNKPSPPNPGPTQGESLFRASALFFQRPTPTKPGILYLDTDSDLQPTRNDTFFSGITDISLTVDPADLQDGDAIHPPRVAAVMITLEARTFAPGAETRNWCPSKKFDGGACKIATGYSDQKKTFRVELRNNVLGFSNAFLGASKRVYDQIYFFKPVLPVGLKDPTNGGNP